MTCILCNSRKAKRDCPARGAICPQCCGEQREETIECPLDCEFLVEARRHERQPALDPAAVPHPDVKVSEAFVARNEALLTFLSASVGGAAQGVPGCVDADVREALDAMVRTYKTASSGLVYETRPANPYAAQIQEKLNESIATLQKDLFERTGQHTLRDSDIMGALVFLARFALHLDNGRRKCRAFLGMLAERFPAAGQSEAPGPGAPSLIL